MTQNQEVNNSMAEQQDPTIVELMIQLGGQVDDDSTTGLPWITWGRLKKRLRESGVLLDDIGIKDFAKTMSRHSDDKKLGYAEFRRAALQNISFLKRVAEKELVIADFVTFTSELEYILETVRSNLDGENAQYIPTLRDADPDQLGLAFCSIHGQFFETGDSRSTFSIQSTSKPTMMAIAIEKLGMKGLTKWVGVAPSGRTFNDTALLPDGRPFNPMVNSGAIMTSAVVASAYPHLCGFADIPTGDHNERAQSLFDEVLLPTWMNLCGDGIVGEIGLDEDTFLAERRTADTNFALAYLMRGKTELPSPVTLETMLDFYFRSCSIEANAAMMSVVAATLANGGLCPLTRKQVFSGETVRQVLSSMVLSGMYDAAGEFYTRIGCPAKSGVSGCLMVVIPSVGGYCVFSPRLDSFGNSVRGVAFAEAVASIFNFHAFDTIGPFCSKLDPRYSSDQSQTVAMRRLRWAISVGDKRATKFANLLKWTALYVAGADGAFVDGNYDVIQDAYRRVTHSEVSKEELQEIAGKIGGLLGHNESQSERPNEDFLKDWMDLLKKNATTLDDIQKDFILETAFTVAQSSGQITQVEHIIVSDVCRALGIPTEVLHRKSVDMKSGRFSLTNLPCDLC